MVEDVDHINAEIFNLCSRLVISSTLYEEQLSTEWGGIRLVHYRSQYLKHSLTTTVETMGQRCYQSNKLVSDAENTTFEVKKLVASAIN